jgi:hypothetical protein
MTPRRTESKTATSDPKGMTDMSSAAAEPIRIYIAGARSELDYAGAVDALRSAGYIHDLEGVYLPSGDPREDVKALCAASLVVHTCPEDARTVTDETVSLTAYGLGIPSIHVGDLSTPHSPATLTAWPSIHGARPSHVRRRERRRQPHHLARATSARAFVMSKETPECRTPRTRTAVTGAAYAPRSSRCPTSVDCAGTTAPTRSTTLCRSAELASASRYGTYALRTTGRVGRAACAATRHAGTETTPRRARPGARPGRARVAALSYAQSTGTVTTPETGDVSAGQRRFCLAEGGDPQHYIQTFIHGAQQFPSL